MLQEKKTALENYTIKIPLKEKTKDTKYMAKWLSQNSRRRYNEHA